jgi:hypothetical protein
VVIGLSWRQYLERENIPSNSSCAFSTRFEKGDL